MQENDTFMQKITKIQKALLKLNTVTCSEQRKLFFLFCNRRIKMSNTVQLNIDERKYCVCCPNCGRLTQKSYLTDSELQCPKCKCNFMALVKNGIITVFEVNFKPLLEDWINKQSKL